MLLVFRGHACSYGHNAPKAQSFFGGVREIFGVCGHLSRSISRPADMLAGKISVLRTMWPKA